MTMSFGKRLQKNGEPEVGLEFPFPSPASTVRELSAALATSISVNPSLLTSVTSTLPGCFPTLIILRSNPGSPRLGELEQLNPEKRISSTILPGEYIFLN